jgi:pyridine nucleotide-disulfide oxidoreductase
MTPSTTITLARHSARHGLPYADIGVPVPLKTFVQYGLAFQSLRVPHLEKKSVVAVEHDASGFRLTLDDGEAFSACRVVVAVGVASFAYLPPILTHLPTELMTHSSAHHDLSCFEGKDITVLGAGASAIDLAVLLHEAGAKVRLVARRAHLDIPKPVKLPRPLSERVLNPMSGIGPSWKSWFFTEAPGVVHYLPQALRMRWCADTSDQPAVGLWPNVCLDAFQYIRDATWWMLAPFPVGCICVSRPAGDPF